MTDTTMSKHEAVQQMLWGETMYHPRYPSSSFIWHRQNQKFMQLTAPDDGKGFSLNLNETPDTGWTTQPEKKYRMGNIISIEISYGGGVTTHICMLAQVQACLQQVIGLETGNRITDNLMSQDSKGQVRESQIWDTLQDTYGKVVGVSYLAKDAKEYFTVLRGLKEAGCTNDDR